MSYGNPRSRVRIAGHPIHPILVPIPIGCFVGALLTDIVYSCTALMQWANFSAWLVTVGLIMGVVAAVIGLIDFLGNPLIREIPQAWLHMMGNLLVLVLALFNTMIHSRDAWTSVVPLGLVLSAATVLVLVFTGWMGWSMVYQFGVAVETGERR